MKSLTLIPPASAGIRRLKAKTVSLAVTKRKLFFILSFLFMVTGFFAKGQTPFFSPQNISPEALNPEQRVIYDKAVNFGTYTDFQIGHVNPISSCLYQDSFLNVEANGLICQNTARFVTRNLEYQAEDDFYWYGQFVFPDDSVGNCYTGDAMFFTDTGKYYGYFVINKQNYELIDLTGGLQILAQVDSAAIKRNNCGVDVLERSSGSGNGMTPEGDGGYQCKPIILTLFTPDAIYHDPMGMSRGVLGFNQTRQALLNSGVSVFQMGLRYKSDVVTYNASVYSGYGTGIEKALDDMSIPGSLSQQVNAKKNFYHADMVILVIRNINQGIAGIAGLFKEPFIPTVANPPYAVVQTNYATIPGYTYAHEIGHLMGGQHYSPTSSGTGHAYDWNRATTRRFLGIKYTTYERYYTIGSANTADQPNTILQFSNPAILDIGQYNTGSYGYSEAAQLYRKRGCTIANYDSYPDDFNIGVSASIANNNSTFNGQFFQGKYIFCSHNRVDLVSWSTGPQGSYTYTWEISYNGGLTYYYYANSINAQYWCFLANTVPFIDVTFRLTVFSPLGYGKIEYYPARIYNCPALGIPYRLSSPSVRADKQLEQSFESQSFANTYNVGPNPAHTVVTAEIGLDRETTVQFTLIDMLGRQTLLFANAIQAKGSHRISLDIANMPTGIYQLLYQHGDQKEMRKLSIIR